MATLTSQQISLAPAASTLAAASVGGDKVAPGDTTFLEVLNSSGSSITVTIDSVTPSNYGDDTNVVVTVAAGARKKIGPLRASRFAGAVDGLVSVTYSDVTTVTVGAFYL